MVAARCSSSTKNEVPTTEELGSPCVGVQTQRHGNGLPRERKTACGRAGGQGHRRLRIQLQAEGHRLRVAHRGGRAKPDLVPFDLPRPSGHLYGLLPRWLAGDFPQRGSSFLLPWCPVRAARGGEQPTLGLRDNRGQRRRRGRQVLGQNPEDPLPPRKRAEASLWGELPPRGGDNRERE